MLGSAGDADDAVQETMVRAWKSLDGFDGRSSLRTWLSRIATHACLDALSDRKRRERPISDGPQGTVHDALEERPRTHWLEPIPDATAIPAEDNPAERVILQQSIRLAMVVSEHAFAMLIVPTFFKTFTKREICDTGTHTEALICVSCGSRAEVDEMVAKALAAGGKPAMPATDHGFMYGWSFYDIDGHHWEVMWMDPTFAAG